ncbi:MAG TPA: inositol monophosphatase family protein [Acidisoma sp.]|jgi:fructose-1,6-bisphosphatase/inositol monophosphatase family enzyme|uniref:inositol monophosphatase family protein n=1 Tax=Acidisoma sp. TaxID=1872115 RepID=UPI002C85FF8B|nr:inositol monophosphatase family protein [Acidisoma sp.]HTI01524.1 inositol monophosphatase family protein [Acidisoma sp.]
MSGFSESDLRALWALMREAARREILPRFRQFDTCDVRTKSGPLDLVTDADVAAERHITAGIHRLFPGALVVGEEATAADPTLLAKIAGADLAVVVDPVDGTANFAAGLPLFGVMAAVIRNGEIVASVIHDPIGDDAALAVRGIGAWMEAPSGKRFDLRVAEAVPLECMTGAINWRYMKEPQRSRLLSQLPRFATTWDYRNAAHEYRLLAQGFAHVAVFARMMPWDHAPGWLIHREAGGYSARLDGSPYTPTETDGGIILAPDRDSWDVVRALIE